jgi:radical SAM superfamily enzyme YgiQ (UPF0313 family)
MFLSKKARRGRQITLEVKMAKIVLATLNARYIHSAFGLRYLHANLGELADEATILEFVISDSPTEIVASILEQSPQIIGFGVYIWNVEQTTKVVADIKRIRPNITIIIGGPEVSYEIDSQPIVALSDYVITGEADIEFYKLCQKIIAGNAPQEKVTYASLASLDVLKLPYQLYNDDDIANRVIYVELSRGCPFTCEFCLSSLEIPVRMFSLENFLGEMQRLMDRGVRQFKFVDRTFNLNMRTSQAILQFFLDRYAPGMFLHFEMIPDRLPESLRSLIARFPAGALQFEIGIQTFNDDVGELISRRQNVDKLEDNFRFLTEQTGVHIHADLIVGLPGESWESFAHGFDKLYALAPQEIQVGILKRLRGTPITRHDAQWQMAYSAHPPYEILSNRLLNFEQIHRLRRFARHWDMIGNSGNFIHSMPLICNDADSAFDQFYALSEWLFRENGRVHSVSLARLVKLVFEYLTVVRKLNADVVAQAIWLDYSAGGRREKPGFLKKYQLSDHAIVEDVNHSSLPARQRKYAEMKPFQN